MYCSASDLSFPGESGREGVDPQVLTVLFGTYDYRGTLGDLYGKMLFIELMVISLNTGGGGIRMWVRYI